MHSSTDNQDLIPRRSPWHHHQARSISSHPPSIHSTADPIRPSSSAFYSKVLLSCASPAPTKTLPSSSRSSSGLHGFLGEDPLLSSLVPSVTVVLEGRSICQRIDLRSHASYASLARALRVMFGNDDVEGDVEVELANAVPGCIVAYEDVENDLLLAGDLSWNDFVRVAKRIRILPVKQKRPTTTLLKQSTA